MEQQSLWKNFLLFFVGGLLALHVTVSQAADSSSSSQSQDGEKSEGCVLTE